MRRRRRDPQAGDRPATGRNPRSCVRRARARSSAPACRPESGACGRRRPLPGPVAETLAGGPCRDPAETRRRDPRRRALAELRPGPLGRDPAGLERPAAGSERARRRERAVPGPIRRLMTPAGNSGKEATPPLTDLRRVTGWQGQGTARAGPRAASRTGGPTSAPRRTHRAAAALPYGDRPSEETHPMTYPPARYLGDTGEVSATYRPTTAPPDLTYRSGTTADYLATGASTDGLFGLYRWNMGARAVRPRPALPPDHGRVVLSSCSARSGSSTARTGSTPSRATSCTSRRAASTASGTSPASPPRMLIHFAPGAPARGLLRGPGPVGDRGPPERRGGRGLLPAARQPVPVGRADVHPLTIALG